MIIILYNKKEFKDLYYFRLKTRFHLCAMDKIDSQNMIVRKEVQDID